MNLSNAIFIPGPTNLPERIRRAIDLPTVDHRSPNFASDLKAIFRQVQNILKTDNGQIFIFPATGTGGWEAAIANTLSRGDRVLACRHGVFSEKWIHLCQHFGLEVDVIECDWRGPANPDLIEAKLRSDPRGEIKAVLVTHNETATGVRSDISAVRQAIDSAGHSAMLFVDGVSSIASMDFEMDAWGVDIAVAGSQKGFMLPAGLAILGVSQKAIASGATADLPRFFFDFRQMMQTTSSGGFPYTPPMQLLAGLNESCKILLEEGLDAVASRHFFIAEGVRRAADAWGLEVCARDRSFASDTVTTIFVPEGRDSNQLTLHLHQKYQMSFGVGLGQFAGQVFRIGHLGQLSIPNMLAGLATIEMAMRDLDYPINAGVGVAAAQEWYRIPISVKPAAGLLSECGVISDE